jgi:hypothetical protein
VVRGSGAPLPLSLSCSLLQASLSNSPSNGSELGFFLAFFSFGSCPEQSHSTYGSLPNALPDALGGASRRR